ncbi:hypothetical protein GXW74_07335 [Roseomonas eburnea]|uniref:Uncharacterized protein n=1 Tax=Neoroseomonas eburnea TaxID=1346889 RepID=A0A9X9X9A8_9PROT|nr:hypothetical protein [Neoroseomonas eburnea]MBR0680294.1 hypothetical protein [Neoroseomonas eburnea]
MTVNPAEEITALGELPTGIDAAEAAPGVADAYGRSGTWVADALGRAVAAGAPVVGIVNADIRLDLDSTRRAALLERAGRAMLVCNRMDVGHAAQEAGPFYRYGYDLVLMPRGMAARLSLEGFALGVPWWDYWVVLDALMLGLPVEVVQCRGVRHLAHAQAWSQPAWRRALRMLMANLGPRRAELGRLGMGEVAEATADLLVAIAPRETEGYPLDEMMTVAGTRFGIELVRFAERHAWSLD